MGPGRPGRPVSLRRARALAGPGWPWRSVASGWVGIGIGWPRLCVRPGRARERVGVRRLRRPRLTIAGRRTRLTAAGRCTCRRGSPCPAGSKGAPHRPVLVPISPLARPGRCSPSRGASERGVCPCRPGGSIGPGRVRPRRAAEGGGPSRGAEGGGPSRAGLRVGSRPPGRRASGRLVRRARRRREGRLLGCRRACPVRRKRRPVRRCGRCGARRWCGARLWCDPGPGGGPVDVVHHAGDGPGVLQTGQQGELSLGQAGPGVGLGGGGRHTCTGCGRLGPSLPGEILAAARAWARVPGERSRAPVIGGGSGWHAIKIQARLALRTTGALRPNNPFYTSGARLARALAPGGFARTGLPSGPECQTCPVHSNRHRIETGHRNEFRFE